jgi:hypothetical protein
MDDLLRPCADVIETFYNNAIKKAELHREFLYFGETVSPFFSRHLNGDNTIDHGHGAPGVFRSQSGSMSEGFRDR